MIHENTTKTEIIAPSSQQYKHNKEIPSFLNFNADSCRAKVGIDYFIHSPASKLKWTDF